MGIEELLDFVGGGYYNMDTYDKDMQDQNFSSQQDLLGGQFRALLSQNDPEMSYVYPDVKGGKVAYASLNDQDKIIFDDLATGYLNTRNGSKSGGFSKNDWSQIMDFFAGRITADKRDARNEKYKLRRLPVESMLDLFLQNKQLLEN
jgi:hypothetical protein|tara:strand:+ start:479 stop:919 length:441 start_codon:yes stop_codon:yes gene_type:complete